MGSIGLGAFCPNTSEPLTLCLAEPLVSKDPESEPPASNIRWRRSPYPISSRHQHPCPSPSEQFTLASKSCSLWGKTEDHGLGTHIFACARKGFDDRKMGKREVRGIEPPEGEGKEIG